MISKIVSFVTAIILLGVAFCLLWALWSPERVFSWISEHQLSAILAALFLFFLALLNFQRDEKSLPSYSFNLLRGRGTVSIETVKKGIKRFIHVEAPNLQIISCHLKEGGKLLELTLSGHTDPSLLERLSDLLANQFGFEGQLDIFLEQT